MKFIKWFTKLILGIVATVSFFLLTVADQLGDNWFTKGLVLIGIFAISMTILHFIYEPQEFFAHCAAIIVVVAAWIGSIFDPENEFICEAEEFSYKFENSAQCYTAVYNNYIIKWHTDRNNKKK